MIGEAPQARHVEHDGAVELGFGLAHALAGKIEMDRVGCDVQLDMAGRAALEGAGARDRVVEIHRLALPGGVAVGGERAVQPGHGEFHVDVRGGPARTVARVVEAGIAVANLETGDVEPVEHRYQVADLVLGRRRGLRRGGFGRGRAEPPIGLALLVDLERDFGLDQREAVDLQLAGQKRPRPDLDLDRFQLRHVRRFAAGRVGEGHVLGRQGQLGQQREFDRPVDAELPAGRPLDQRDDFRPVDVARDEKRQRDRDREHHDVQGGKNR
ncbi:MAG: hypothetical protein ABSC26_03340 [Stellaceae bacterium]